MQGQKQKLMNLLADDEWHCTSEFYAMYMADPRSRLSALKKDGFNLSWRWCNTHKHDGNQKQWKLEKRVQGCCTSWILLSFHDKQCANNELNQVKSSQLSMNI